VLVVRPRNSVEEKKGGGYGKKTKSRHTHGPGHEWRKWERDAICGKKEQYITKLLKKNVGGTRSGAGGGGGVVQLVRAKRNITKKHNHITREGTAKAPKKKEKKRRGARVVREKNQQD